MATNWPNSVQTFTNPSAGDSLNSPSHSAQHTTVNDTVEALQTYAGLVLVKETTIGSSVSSVTVNDCFNATFQNYRVVVNVLSASTPLSIRVRVNNSTTNYFSSKYGVRYGGGTFTGLVNNDAPYMDLGSCGSSAGGSMTFDVIRPFATQKTLFNGTACYAHTNTGGSVWYAGFHNSALSVTSLTFLTSTGTISSGKIRVYGYNDG